MDQSDTEENCFFRDDVTYLKDAGKEPSLNTMIRQDLGLGPPMNEISLNISEPKSPILPPFSADKIIISEDPLLSAAKENNSDSIYCDIDNVQDDKSRYSPEIVCNPRRRKQKAKKTDTKQISSSYDQTAHKDRQCLTKQQTGILPTVLTPISIKHPCTATVDAENFKETSLEAPILKLATPTFNANANNPTTCSPALAITPTKDLEPIETYSLPKLILLKRATPTCTVTQTTKAPVSNSVAPIKTATNDSDPAIMNPTEPTLNLKPLTNNQIQIVPNADAHPRSNYPIQELTVPSLAALSLAALSTEITQKCSAIDKVKYFADISFSSAICSGTAKSLHENERPSPSSNRIEEIEFACGLNPYDADFSPDDDDPDYQLEDDIQNTSHTSCESLDIGGVHQVQQRKRAKRGKAVKENWISESNKIKRMRGESYCGRRKKEDGKVVYDVEKEKRCVKTRCVHTETCKFFKCYKLTEEMRNTLFSNYWNQSWEGKKVWVQQTVQKKKVATRKCSGNHRRENTFKYTFNVKGENIPVCKKMYLNTLNIGEWSVQNWAKNEDKGQPAAGTKSKRNENLKALDEFGRDYCKEFLNKLPKLESHYCRKTTSKEYLEPIWQSKRELYREYIRQLTETGKSEFKVSVNIFHDEFEAMNLGLFSPKKDQCDLCCSYKVGNVSDEIYNEHRSKKQLARDEKTRDKDNKDSSIKVFTFDLQAVLLSPALKASALYYKTKLKVHNFTIFDIQTSEAYCFIWNESEGGVSADEFSSILNFFLKNHVGPNVKHVILWSDGCTNQNRNAILANSLLQVAVQKNVTITHKYLEKGHTQMECDSMHSTIERQIRNREIYSPAQYVEICRSARLQKPYNVTYLQYDFFRRFSSMPYLNSIRPGKKAGEATVFDLRCIRYTSDGKIFVKIGFTEEFQELARRIKKPGLNDSMPPLYQSRLPIQRSKYIHLQELKEVLPHDIHGFYDDLPHQCPDVRRNENCTCRKQITRAN